MLGEGNLIFRDDGKRVSTFSAERTGEAVRVEERAEFFALKADPRIIAACHRRPLVPGIGDTPMFAPSDMDPLPEYPRRMIVLADGNFASLTPNTVEIIPEGRNVRRLEEVIEW